MNDSNQRTMATEAAFEMSRHVPAAPDAVWRAWTESEQLQHWWGPKGFPPCHCELDLRPGGRFHYGLSLPDGGVIWGRWDIERIVPGQRLEFVSLFSDENGGGPTRHPWEPEWPLETYSEIILEPEDGGTRVRIRWTPVNAADNEIARFAAGHDDCRQGWTGTLDQLEAYL